MQTQTLTLVDPGTVFGLLRWSILAILIIITIFLIANRKEQKKGNKWLPALVVTIIATPFLIINVITTTQPTPTVPKTNPVQPTPPEPEPTPDPIPEPEPEPEPTPVTPSKKSTKPSEAPKKSDQKKEDNKGEEEEPKKEAHHLYLKDAEIISDNSSATYTEGEEITIKAAVKAGYTFKRWLSDLDDINDSTENPLTFTMPDELLLVTAEFTANTDTPYVVKHYVMDIAGDYQLEETENLKGTTDTTVTPDAKEYDGCNSAETASKTIAGDGSTVFEYYYERKEYQFTLNEAEHGSAAANVANGKYYHGREMTLTANPATGYHFVKWSNGETANPYTFNLTTGTTIAPEFAPNTNTQYIVNHNQMDVAGAYHLKESETLYGTTDTTVTPDAKEYTGFEEPERQPQQIAGDGSTVFEYNYPRKEIQFALNDTEHGTAIATLNNGSYYYGREITLSATPATGYHFVKWSNNETANPYTFELKSETTISAEFAPNTYTIAYDKNNADATGDDMAAQSGVAYDSTVKLSKNTYTVSGWRFLGWATSADATVKEYSDEEEGVLNLSSENGATVTLYAVWEEKFPIVWQQTGDCEFHGNNGTISGNCGEYNGQKFINTGIKLFDETNHDKDFDVYFEVEGFSGPQSDSNQTTLFSSKAATGLNIGAPGIVVRGNTNNTRIEYKSTTGNEVSYTYPSTNSAKIRIVRKDGVIYYSLNAKELLFVLDERGDDYQVFDSDVWFGAGEKIIDGQLTPQRVFTGTISNMYIRLGEMDDYEAYTIEFNTNGGKINEGAQANKIATIERGKSIEKLPVPYRTNYIFQGWTVKGSNPVIEVNDGVTPDSDVTYFANWKKDISFANIANPDIELEIQGSEAINITNANSIEGLSYSSDNTAVATIDDSGNVTAVAAGETTITITGLESGKTKTVNVTVLAPKVQITFDDQMGNTSSNQLRIGETLGQLTNDISLEHYIFRGWYTDETAGEKVSSSTTVTGEATYYAHWTKTVYHLSVTPNTINVDKGYVANFGFGDVSDIEGFDYHIENENIATIDSTAITGIAIGSTRLVIEGEESTETKYVDVVVLPHMVTVTFDYADGTPAGTSQIEEGTSFAELPTKVRENYYLEGWFTQANGQGTQLTTNTQIQSQGNSNYYYAYWLASVATATVSPTELGLTVGESSTISVSNDNEELEPFSFSIEDGTIASVNDQGEVTALAAGHTTITITGGKTNDTRTVSVSVAQPTVTVNFDGNGGTPSVASLTVNEGSTISELPTATRDGYIFKDWWTEKTDGDKLTESTVITEGATYYAHWEFNTMPIVWQHQGQCDFAATDDNNGSVSGNECSYAGEKYIDTRIALFNKENYDKDFEIGFQIDEYYAPSSDNSINPADGKYHAKQETFVNAKETRTNIVTNAPGIIIRMNSASSKKLESNANDGHTSTIPTGYNPKITTSSATSPTINLKVTMVRQNGVMKAKYGNDETLHEISGYTQDLFETGNKYFDLTTWFGAYINKNYADPTPNKFLSAKLSHMYIKLEAEEPRIPQNVATFKTASDAVENYYANVNAWNAGEDEGTFLAAMKDNFDSHQCKYSASDDLSEDFPAEYKYGDGNNYCDRPDTFDTGVNGVVSVYRIIDETTGEKESTPVTYAGGSNGKITNLIPGEMYYWESDDDSDVYGFIKAEGTRRMISLSSARNVRDLGGLVGLNGKKLKYGILLRGEQMDSNDVSILQNNLGIDLEYELRRTSQNGSHFANAYRKNQTVYNYNFNYGVSPHYETTKASFLSFMQDVIDGKSIYFHCSHGADRTGTIAYLAEAILGVDYETRARDYELTALSGRPDKTRYYDHKGTPPFNVADNTEFHPGRKYKHMISFVKTNEQVVEWLKADLTTDEEKQAIDTLIEQFRAAMLEGYGD